MPISIKEEYIPKKNLIRPMDKKRDLNKIANLIELCFADTLDEDGYNYLKMLRKAARNYISGNNLFSFESLVLNGYVYEEDNKILGNLSILPFTSIYYPFGEKVYLIANVAVHPQHRRKGIAKALTTTALRELKQKNKGNIWLQVRIENKAALELYTSLGFVEKFRRTTWISDWKPNSHLNKNINESPIIYKNREKKIWHLQKKWFLEVYPPEMGWYYSVNLHTLQPNFFGLFSCFLANLQIRQWAAYNHDELIGVIGWQPTNTAADYLWLMVSPTHRDEAIHSLLAYIYQRFGNQRCFAIDYPYQKAAEVLMQSGFKPHNTLVWMVLPP